MSIPRIRTLTECLKELKAADPGSCVTKHYLRQVVDEIPGTFRAGRKILVNMEEIEKFLSDPDRAEKDRLLAYQRAQQAAGIRPVGGGGR